MAPPPAPIATPKTTTASAALDKDRWKDAVSIPNRAEEKARVDPTLTSISPATMTSVMP